MGRLERFQTDLTRLRHGPAQYVWAASRAAVRDAVAGQLRFPASLTSGRRIRLVNFASVYF
jgi:hypothetical protein